MLILSNDDVQQVLDMPTCITALEEGYQDLMRGDAAYGGRTNFSVPEAGTDGFFRFGSMEGATRRLGVFAIRMKLDMLYWQEGPGGLTEEKYSREPGTYCGLVLLVSTRNAEPLAMVQDGYLQHMRVGGSAGIGARHLARANASTVGMLGSGGMARSFLRAFCAVRDIDGARVYSPTREHREAYAAEMSEAMGIPVEAVDTPQEAVKGTDIFSVCADAMSPVMNADWLEAGMHLTGSSAGPRLMDSRVPERADVIIKLGYGAGEGEGLATSTKIGTPEERARDPRHKEERSQETRPSYPHLVDLLAKRVPGRTSDRQITYFIDEGTQGLQFAAVAGTVYELARERGLGREFPTEWLLQDIRD